MSTNKSIVGRPVVALAVIVAVGLGVYVVFKIFDSSSQSLNRSFTTPRQDNTQSENTSTSSSRKLKKYSNPSLGVEFDYPAEFNPYLRDNEYVAGQPARYTTNADSYAPSYGSPEFRISLEGPVDSYYCIDGSGVHYPGVFPQDVEDYMGQGRPIRLEDCTKNPVPTLEKIAHDEINHKLKPFGENPVVTKIAIEGQEGRVIKPSSKFPNYEGVLLILNLKNPVFGYRGNYIVFTVSATSRTSNLELETVDIISKSIHFIGN